jgi:hypothetical protein
MYGYQVLRGEGGGRARHWSSVRAGTQRFEDATVAPAGLYTYSLRPYDIAGNHGLESDHVSVQVPGDAPLAARDVPVAAHPDALDGCTATDR